MRKLDFIQSSVFIDERFQFTGNQLATFWKLNENDLTFDEMLGIAQEMNFSETTFVYPSHVKPCIRKVRIFTPGIETPFAGHPTLGTAYILKNQLIIDEDSNEAILELGIGPIKVDFPNKGLVQMYQPQPRVIRDFQNKTVIAEILGLPEKAISEEYPIEFVSTGFPFLIIPINSLENMKSINIDAKLLSKTLTDDFPSKNLLVFSLESEQPDSHAHVRMFAPLVGVAEDPATGSAAGPLGAYLEMHNLLKQEKGKTIILEQGYEIHRPSRLIVKCIYEKEEIKSVIVGGKVRITAHGTFYLTPK